MNLKPSEIYFTQDSIGSTFGRCTQHNRVKIGDTLDKLVSGKCTISSIPKINVMEENGKWWTADNRRLWIFRHLEKLGKCSTIPVNIVYSINSSKRTTTNGGTDVRIYRGSDPGGCSWRRVISIKIPDKVKENKTHDIENSKDKKNSCIKEKDSDILRNNNEYTPLIVKNSNVLEREHNGCSSIPSTSRTNLSALTSMQNQTRSSEKTLVSATKNLSVINTEDTRDTSENTPPDTTSSLNLKSYKSFCQPLKRKYGRFEFSPECPYESPFLFCHTKKRKGILKKTLKFKANISGNSWTNLSKVTYPCLSAKRVHFRLRTTPFNCNIFTSNIVYPGEELPDDPKEELQDDTSDTEDDSIFAIDPSEYLDSPESFDFAAPDEWNTPDENKVISKSNPFDNWKESDDDRSNSSFDSDSSNEYDYRDYDLDFKTKTLWHEENETLSDDETSSEYGVILDKIYKKGEWDSDTDDMYYDYID